MAQKGIREYDAKRLVGEALAELGGREPDFGERLVLVTPKTDLDRLEVEHPWLKAERLVVKPDQLFGKRGKNNLLYLDKNFAEVKDWIGERMGREVTVGRTRGRLTHFLIEPFVPHEVEYYLALSLIHI